MVASEVAIVAGAVAVLGAYFGVIKAKQRKLIQAALGFGVAVAGAVYFFLSLAGIS